MKFIGIIPARYASTRFPGKPLAMLGNKTVIERVYTRASKALDEVAVATDDSRIYEVVEAFGGKAIMTSPNHRSGTDRCFEAFEKSSSDADVIINIQGDEPFIDPAQIEALKGCFDSENVEIATLIRPFDRALGIDALVNPNSPKVVCDNNENAIYFSRSVIPYLRSEPDMSRWPEKIQYYTHVGIYAFRSATLAKLVKLPQAPLEIAESLEQLRWLSAGYKIRTAITECPTIGIDTPADLQRAIKFLETK